MNIEQIAVSDVTNNSFSPDDGQVHYTARFPDGTVFDSTYKRGRPLTMRIGAGKVCSICLCVTACTFLTITR